MLVKTRYFGMQEVDPQSMLFFPEGLPGLEHCRRFKLFHEEHNENPVLRYLQSLDDPEIVFSVVEPSWLDLEYDLPLAKWEARALRCAPNIDVNKNLLVLIMLSRSAEGGRIQPLLEQPLLINPETRRGIQLQLNQEDVLISRAT